VPTRRWRRCASHNGQTHRKPPNCSALNQKAEIFGDTVPRSRREVVGVRVNIQLSHMVSRCLRRRCRPVRPHHKADRRGEGDGSLGDSEGRKQCQIPDQTTHLTKCHNYARLLISVKTRCHLASHSRFPTDAQ